MPRRGSDPNNSLIEGRVLLPSGQSANFNIKIILSDLKSNLATLYTNKHAEFRFPNLSEGVYYVQAVGDEKVYEPVTATVRLARSQVFQLSITLRAKVEFVSRKSGTQIISAAEFNQTVPAAARKKYGQGVKLVGKGDAEQAIDHFQQAIAIYPDYVAAHNDLGAQYLKLKQFVRAAEHFRLALEQNPKYFNALFNLALVRMEERDYAGAIAQLNQAIEIDSSR
ncbi:MAG: tetratricopeptide repeat protein, partial [Blastocatellia bacterium]